MFSFAMFTLFLSCNFVLGIILPREAPSEGWMTDYLEPYADYYTRYIALSCQTKDGSDFFDRCCRPLLTAENLSDRPSECSPVQDDGLRDGNADDTTSLSRNLVVSDIPEIVTTEVTDIPVTTTSEEATAPTNTEASALRPIVAARKLEALFSKYSAFSEVYAGGFATYYYQNGNAGACGSVRSDYDQIVAIHADRYGDLGQRSNLCGKRVQITNNENSKSVIATIADACPTCVNKNSLDLSVGCFESIATLDKGIVPISWSFI